MSRKWLYCAWALLLLLVVACDKDDDYVYPSVKLEFLTAVSGNDGNIQTLITDKGEHLTVANDLTGSKIAPNSSVRVVSNYEQVSSAQGENAVKVYALIKTVSPDPKRENQFGQGIKTDPADVLSIWMGRNYLNIILSIEVKEGKHLFHFVEQEISDNGKQKVITLLLYHDAGGDAEFFSRRAYLSVPLQQYYNATTDAGKEIIIKFKYWTYNRKGEKVLEDKYAKEGFKYLPCED